MGHTLTVILIVLLTFHFKWNHWTKLAQASELPEYCSISDHRKSHCHGSELTDTISNVADPRSLNDKNVLLQKDIDIHPDKRLVLDIKHDFDIFIEFHESRTETTKLSLLLTAEDAGDNRVNSLPVHRDYTVASLELENVINLQLVSVG
ncbi:hypothetical protein Btru_040257 [Bulinus truncatus]|nr:hypothetical protein Btru_040257 [Bulinus truncatus]